jgi:multiple sugar transport system permease protein
MKLGHRTINKQVKENMMGYLFILPQFLGVIVFSVIPIVFSLYLSFTEWDFLSGFSNIKWIGMKNFIDIWKDVAFTDSLKNTLVFSVATIVFELGLGVVVAVLIDKYVYASNYFKVVFFIPYISSLVAVSVVFKAILQPSFGPVNQFLMAIGITNPPKWFGDYRWSLTAVIMLTVWRDLGYYVIVFLAAVKGVSKELYEAAALDGGNGLQQFWYITLPLVKPTTFFLMVTGIIGSFKAFDQIAVTTQGGPGTSSSVLVYYIYNSAFRFYKMGYASAMAWVLFVLIFIITLIQWKYQKIDVE